MTNALQTEAGITPLSYFGRAKRSTQPLSDLIQNTTVHVIRECPDCYYIVDILRAIAKANGLTFEELFNKIESFETDQENRTAKLTAEPNSDYSGSVTVNYYF